MRGVIAFEWTTSQGLRLLYAGGEVLPMHQYDVYFPLGTYGQGHWIYSGC